MTSWTQFWLEKYFPNKQQNLSGEEKDLLGDGIFKKRGITMKKWQHESLIQFKIDLQTHIFQNTKTTF